MGATTTDVLNYPFVEEKGLDVDPMYRRLQRSGPVRIQMAFGDPCWLATSYEDVKTVHVDRRFSKAAGLGRDVPRREGIYPTDPSLLANMDPPEHTRLRRLASGGFSPARMRELNDWVASLVDGLLDDLIEQGSPGDFHEAVARRLPNAVVTGILGVPGDEVPLFRGWIDRMLAMNSPLEDRSEAQSRLDAYIVGLVAARRRRPTDDLLSVLVHAHDLDDRLTEQELVMLCVSLFLGGFETTVSQLGSTVYVLLSDRRLWEDLIAQPQLMPAALEELWRWIPSHRYGKPLIRWAVEDIELSEGVVIRAGDAVLPERPVANRDESVFPHGWDLDFHRTSPKPHLALGFGSHHCMGANLAHLEIQVTLQRLLERLPSLELAVPAADVNWSKVSFMRSVESLPVTW
jgi:cytochrome P450 RapN